VEELGLEPDYERQLWDYLVYAAASMVNTPG
jgi:hemoglobin